MNGNGYNAYGQDPTDDFDRWEANRMFSERAAREEQAAIERWEAEREERWRDED